MNNFMKKKDLKDINTFKSEKEEESDGSFIKEISYSDQSD